MTLLADRIAVTDNPVLDMFAERWSTRVFDAHTPIDEEALASALEAARWAPSANNVQPWRFIVARRGSAAHAKLVATLGGFNASWAPAAGALVAVLVDTVREDGTPARWAEYDAGQAAAYFSLQAHAHGLFTHQMAGFDHDAMAEAFGLPETITPLTIIALGALGDHAAAPDELLAREQAPRVRRPLAQSLLLDD